MWQGCNNSEVFPTCAVRWDFLFQNISVCPDVRRLSGRANFPIIGRDSWEMIDKFISLRMLNVDEYGYRHFYHNAEQYCYLYAILFISKGIWRTKYEKSIQLCLLIVFDKLRYPLPYKRGKFLSLKLIFIESVLYLLPKMYQRIIIHAH